MTELETAIIDYLENSPESSLKDLLNEVKSIVKGHKEHLKKAKKDNDVKSGVVKPLNPYQLFVKEQMKVFKDNGTSLTGKELMKEISALWKAKKEGVSEPELSTPPQSPRSEPEPENEAIKDSNKDSNKGSNKGSGKGGFKGGVKNTTKNGAK